MRRSKQRASNEYAGVYNTINRSVREGRRDLGQSTSAIKGSYGGASKGISAIGKSIVPQTKSIAGGYNQSLGKAADLLGGGGSIGATTAAGTMTGTLAEGTLGTIWNNARTDQGYNRGMGEALVFDRQRMLQQARLRYQEILDEARETREATAREEAARAAEIADQLRAERQSRRLAEWMQDFLRKRYLGGGGGGQVQPQSQLNVAPGPAYSGGGGQFSPQALTPPLTQPVVDPYEQALLNPPGGYIPRWG
jgi:hypothetical protein